jgi:hypothetical protein
MPRDRDMNGAAIARALARRAAVPLLGAAALLAGCDGPRAPSPGPDRRGEFIAPILVRGAGG